MTGSIVLVALTAIVLAIVNASTGTTHWGWVLPTVLASLALVGTVIRVRIE
jgi:hypothetical protein